MTTDKVHFNTLGGGYVAHGIKKQRHVSDNRNGFTLHPAGLPGSQLPLFFQWNGLNESNTDCYIDMVNQLFGHGMSSNNIDNCNLRNVAFASDRGYWGWELVSWCLIRGADIIGTVQRAQWFCFTYNQIQDKRIMIAERGAANAFYKSLTHYQPGAKSITAVAFRNGTGSVSLAMSTVMRHAQWVFVLLTPAEAKSRRMALESDNPALALKRLGFRSFCGQSSDQEIDWLLTGLFH